MALPQPDVPLDNICSAIYNNTLYTYSAQAFQALPLTPGAAWQQLPYGESVAGGVCVGSTPADASQAGFFVVGGKGADAAYNGLQKYTYATGQWASLTPQTLVTQDRLYHGAVYLNASDSIFMYAGAQDGSTGASTQTFTIQASAPYAVVAFQSSAPPTVNPIVLPWSAAEAIMVGGSTSNTDVMLFDPANGGWFRSGATLQSPLAISTAGLQAALVTGDDGSKNLYTFDATTSPNTVSRIVLVDGTGAPVTNAAPVAKRALGTGTGVGVGDGDGDGDLGLAVRSALTQSDWPAYNASLAPTAVRSGFATAQDANGLVIIAGGADSDVLCVFNGRTNAWRNATQMLSSKATLINDTSSASSSSTFSSTRHTATPTTLVVAPSTSATTTDASATATSTPTAAAAGAATTPHSLSANAILGITLGSVAGLGLLLLLLFVLLQRRRRRRDYLDAAHNRRASGTSSSEKDAFAVANDSLPQRSPLGGGGIGGAGKGTFRGGHHAQDSQGSFNSVAILMGRVNQPRTENSSGGSGSGGGSSSGNGGGGGRPGAGSSLFNKGLKSTISKPIPQTRPEPDPTAAAVHYERGGGAGIGAGAAAAATSAYGRSVTNPRQQQQQQQSQQAASEVRRQGSTRRSSGWNRYWSGGSALNILGFGSGGNGPNGRNSKRTTVASDASSSYSTNNTSNNSNNMTANRITQDSATVPPLDLPSMPEAKPRFQRVNSGSPTIANYHNFVRDGIEGKIERSNSHGSTHSGYSSGIPASVSDLWDPTSSSGDRPWGADRAPSSAYYASSSAAAAAAGGNPYHTPLAPASSAAGSKKAFAPTPSGMGRQPQLAMADTSSDMSWLNLGDVAPSRL